MDVEGRGVPSPFVVRAPDPAASLACEASVDETLLKIKVQLRSSTQSINLQTDVNVIV
jgi:hypothetical protein